MAGVDQHQLGVGRYEKEDREGAPNLAQVDASLPKSSIIQVAFQTTPSIEYDARPRHAQARPANIGGRADDAALGPPALRKNSVRSNYRHIDTNDDELWHNENTVSAERTLSIDQQL